MPGRASSLLGSMDGEAMAGRVGDAGIWSGNANHDSFAIVAKDEAVKDMVVDNSAHCCRTIFDTIKFEGDTSIRA
jgi:hypothetical protein